jgi:hypothetical protein
LVVEGITYYCEYRKCGKPACKCAGGDDLHGPYWYARDAGGNVGYIGKVLPGEVERAHQALIWTRGDIDRARDQLLEQAAALRALSVCDSVTAKQRAIIEAAGFGYCLVSQSQLATTQDAGLLLASEPRAQALPE